MIMDTCGTIAVVPKFPNAAQSEVVMLGGRYHSWGTASISSPGGQYRLCWCAGGAHTHECDSALDFIVDAGRFTIVGPTSTRDSTCIAGQTCWFDGVQGQHLSDNDQVMPPPATHYKRAR